MCVQQFLFNDFQPLLEEGFFAVHHLGLPHKMIVLLQEEVHTPVAEGKLGLIAFYLFLQEAVFVGESVLPLFQLLERLLMLLFVFP